MEYWRITTENFRLGNKTVIRKNMKRESIVTNEITVRKIQKFFWEF